MTDTMADARAALAQCGVLPPRPDYAGEFPRWLAELPEVDTSHLWDDVALALIRVLWQVSRRAPGPLAIETVARIGATATAIVREHNQRREEAERDRRAE